MKSLFLMVSLLFPVLAVAQSLPADEKQNDLLGQGTFNVGVNVGGGYGYGSSLNGRIIPRLQYFLKDGWSIALEARLETVTNPDQSRDYAGAGLLTRYYFIRDRRLALFGQAGATYGAVSSQLTIYNPVNPYSIYRSIYRGNALQISAGLGVHYRVATR